MELLWAYVNHYEWLIMWLLAIKCLQIGVTRSAGLNSRTPIGQRIGVITRKPYEEQP